MPRVKSFDVGESVGKAMMLFWSKGYDATSMIDLIEHTGINRGSLYNAFNDKSGLFSKCLLLYDQSHRRESLSKLETMDDPGKVINTLFQSLVDESVNDTQSKGCLLVNTALELPRHGKEVRTIVKSALRDFEQFFVRTIELGQARGQFPETLNSTDTAKALLSLVVGIRVLSRGAYDTDALQAMANQAAQLLNTER